MVVLGEGAFSYEGYLARSPLPPYAPPFAPSHAPLYAPGGATDGSPCLIQAWVGSWVCTAWAWPCSGGWFVPSLLGSSS